MKLTVIGGGGVRTLFLAKSVASRAEELNIRKLVLSDTDSGKLKIYGGLAKETANRICPALSVELTADKTQAVKNADYIITTIRAGGDEMRVKEERLALNLGLLGQETTGAAGFGFAMRSLPALEEYFRLAEKYAEKDVKIFNFTNPAGLVSQTLSDIGFGNFYGICDAPQSMLNQISDYYKVSAADVTAHCYGLNHLSFFRNVKVNGRDVTSELIGDLEAYNRTDLRFFDAQTVKRLGEIPNEYLYYYFYPEKAVENILKAPRTRGEAICDINGRMTKEFKNRKISDFESRLKVFEKYYGERENSYMSGETGVSRDKKWRFDLNSADDGGYAGVALGYIGAASGKAGNMIMCLPNCGALDFLRPDDIIESTCAMLDGKCAAIKTADVKPVQKELILRVKAYERQASYALRVKSRDAVIDALYLNPLVNSYSAAATLADGFLTLNKPFIGEWK